MWKTSANEDAVTIQMDAATCAEQEHFVKTAFGSISVLVSGDQTRPALITYPDVALNYLTCFHGLFLCPEAASLLCENFCIYHINAPGHELGAAAIPSDQSYLTVDDLADQVAEVLDYFELQEVLCMGVTAGAYILTLFATKYRERVAGLVLISPLCRPPSWTEWLCNKLVINLLYFCGMCGIVKEVLLRRYFSQVLRPGGGVEEDPDILEVWGKHLGERHSENVLRLLQGIHMRRDLSYDLKKLKCRTLVFVGEHSPFLDEALHFTRVMDRRYIALVEVQACGSLVTEEIPSAMHVPLECFLMGYGFYRPAQVASHFSSPTSPLSPPCISADLLSPQSLGLKLKPIKTRVVVDD